MDPAPQLLLAYGSDYASRSVPRAREDGAANHAHAVAIYFMHYNFVRIHQTLMVTPAMVAGVTDRLWEMSDMVKVLEEWDAAPNE